jgi:hypothetical protein
MINLKLDNSITRENDRGTRNDPKEPLTPEEQQDIKKNDWIYCKIAYVNRMMKSRLYDPDVETVKDLENDAWIFFENILGKFDKSFFKGRIAKKYDVSGNRSPKTLGWYFRNYFSHRVQQTAQESRNEKKKRGIGPAEHMDDIAYDPVDMSSGLSEHMFNYEVTGEIWTEVKKRDRDFQRFFVQLCIEQCTQKELREEYKDRYKMFKAMLTDIKNRYAEKYKLNMSGIDLDDED